MHQPVHKKVRRKLVRIVGEVYRKPSVARPLHVIADIVVEADDREHSTVNLIVLENSVILGTRSGRGRMMHAVQCLQGEEALKDWMGDLETHKAYVGNDHAHGLFERIPLLLEEEVVDDQKTATLQPLP